ncbi:hypothetical protein [Arthrobacter sp. H5]|nr:hypothetical protein [Arthrobacter sp. H5]
MRLAVLSEAIAPNVARRVAAAVLAAEPAVGSVSVQVCAIVESPFA